MDRALNLFSLLDQAARASATAARSFAAPELCTPGAELRERALRLATSIRSSPGGRADRVASENRPESSS